MGKHATRDYSAVSRKCDDECFILRQHFLSIPTSIVETAKLDGVGPVKFLFSVLIPMSKGVLVGVSIIMFVYAWNQYLWPLVIIDSQANQGRTGWP